MWLHNFKTSARLDDIPHTTFVKVSRAKGNDGLGERWARECVSPMVNLFDNTGSTRAVVLVVDDNLVDMV